MPTLLHTLINNNIRQDHRKPKNISYLRALITPIQWLLDIGEIFAEEIFVRVSHNSQIIYLEHLLNLIFNNDTPGILIIDTANIEYTYLANKHEGYDPSYLFNTLEGDPPTPGGYDPVFVGNNAEYANQFDFIVKVPALVYVELLLNNEQGLNYMKSQINFYKLAGKRYKIESL